MPTYEYACRQCGEHVEVVQSFRDDPLTVCGLCGGSLRKVFGAAGIIFKGSGYYVTDSRKKPARSGSKGGDSGSGSAAGDQQSSDTKPTDRQGSAEQKSGAGRSAGKADAAESA